MSSQKKSRKVEPEILTFGDESFAKLFMEAVRNASRRTHISNNSITSHEEFVAIEPTTAYFLIEVGQEYQKLLNKQT
jgi:hypothetical protein